MRWLTDTETMSEAENKAITFANAAENSNDTAREASSSGEKPNVDAQRGLLGRSRNET